MVLQYNVFYIYIFIILIIIKKFDTIKYLFYLKPKKMIQSLINLILMDYQLITGEKRKESDRNNEPDRKKMRQEYMLGKENDVNIYSNDNHIYYYSSVTKKSALELNTEIRKVTRTLLRISSDFNTNPPPIYLHINSYGGSVFAALSVIDTIQYNPVPVYTIIEGAAVSAATMISVHGKKRYITKSGHMLIHQLSSGFWGKNV